jgi:hypothetical protein
MTLTLLLAFLLAAVALLLIDWRQTLTIFRRGRREKNRAIRWAYARWGRRGIDGYFACWVAGVALFHSLVPYGFVGSALVALVQTVVVVRNHRHGIRLN